MRRQNEGLSLCFRNWLKKINDYEEQQNNNFVDIKKRINEADDFQV
jgi:hypothetical protein